MTLFVPYILRSTRPPSARRRGDRDARLLDPSQSRSGRRNLSRATVRRSCRSRQVLDPKLRPDGFSHGVPTELLEKCGPQAFADILFAQRFPDWKGRQAALLRIDHCRSRLFGTSGSPRTPVRSRTAMSGRASSLPFAGLPEAGQSLCKRPDSSNDVVRAATILGAECPRPPRAPARQPDRRRMSRSIVPSFGSIRSMRSAPAV